MKLYIESIEGGTYLASVAETEQQNLVRDNASKPKVFSSLN